MAEQSILYRLVILRFAQAEKMLLSACLPSFGATSGIKIAFALTITLPVISNLDLEFSNLDLEFRGNSSHQAAAIFAAEVICRHFGGMNADARRFFRLRNYGTVDGHEPGQSRT